MPHYRILLHRPLTCLSHRCALAVLGNAFLKHLRTTDYLWQIFCMGFVFLKTVPETPRHRVLPRRPCADPSSASLRVGGVRERVLGSSAGRNAQGSRTAFLRGAAGQTHGTFSQRRDCYGINCWKNSATVTIWIC